MGDTHAHEVIVRADRCVIEHRTEIKKPKAFKVKRFSKAMSQLLYSSLYGSVFHFFKILNQKARFKTAVWHMKGETLEHVGSLIKVFKWIVLPASILYVFAEFYFFGENALDSMFLGVLVFFYSNFLPDLPSIYYRRKKYDRITENLLWDEKCALLLFAPLFVGGFLCGIRLRWHTLETFHNFKSLTIYVAFLFILGFFAFGNITEILRILAYENMTKLSISIGEVTEILSLPLYGAIGYLTHLKVDHHF